MKNKWGIKNKSDQFMHFDAIIYAPINLGDINTEKLNNDEKLCLNSYHKLVYEILANNLNDKKESS